jgi:erythromycin esterase
VLAVEGLKLRRSPALLVAVGTPLALAALLCLGLTARSELTGSPYWSWQYYFQMTRAFWGVFVAPILLAVLAALTAGIEHRQDNWKSQLVQPVSIGSLYRAKFLVLVLLATTSQLVLYVSTVVLGRSLQLAGAPPAAELAITLSASVTALPLLAFQYGLSLRWPSFLLPVGIGAVANFASLVGSAFPVAGVRPGYYLPWSFFRRALRVSGAGVERPLAELAIACCMAFAILWVAQFHFTERGRGRLPRSAAQRRAARVRYAVAGLAIVGTLAALTGMHLQQEERVASLRARVAHIDVAGEIDDFSDLEAFGHAIGDSRVVLLGEASHGDGATLRLKSRLVRYLHKRKGFDVLAFESGLYDCLRAGEEIVRGGDPVEWGERSIAGVWARSAEVRPLLEYLGETVDGGRPLRLAGFDMRWTGDVSTDLLVVELEDFLAATYPSVSASEDRVIVSRNLRELATDAEAWRDRGEAHHDEALAAIERLAILLRGYASDGEEAGTRTDFWARNLASLAGLMRFVRALDPDDPASIREAAPIRERTMADNLLWLVTRRFPDRKIIVWGATSHLSRNRDAIAGPAGSSMVPMGQKLWDAIGERSYVAGFSSFEGRTGVPREVVDRKPRDVGVAPEGSLEDLLARAGADVGFVDLRGAAPGSVLASRLEARPLGHAPLVADWHRVLDGLFFIRTMTPSTSADAARSVRGRRAPQDSTRGVRAPDAARPGRGGQDAVSPGSDT